VGPDTLRKFIERARLLKDDPNGRPYLKGALTLPVAPVELFFDVEVDPMRDICYLHGVLERRDGDNSTERFLAFFAHAPTPNAEKDAFAPPARAGPTAEFVASSRCLWALVSCHTIMLHRALPQGP
jgi:hypothetical protein